jgi:eukaryotic-like serine/threonine-protein kinase
MSLKPQDRLGPYEILAPIGAGGMGEVYRARDTRLDRVVAIKVLPEHLSSNPQLRERLEREAKAISSLSHPHICSLYDIGHQDGVDFLVMEYLEGETLAHRIKKGALPPEQLFQYAIQISDALDTAHRHGVIHRDLKPGNIMLTKSGAKLLDFGLAKVRAAEAAAGMTALPTQTTPLTGEGTILGTLQYMAPEQLEGAEADARADIFALGAVIYEMATGRKAFEGKSQASLIAAIMQNDPLPVAALQPATPPALEHVVRICLAKDPGKRWQSVSDVKLELQWIAEARSSVESSVAAPKVRTRRAQWFGLALASLLVGAAAGVWLGRTAVVQTPVFRYLTYSGHDSSPAVSPDGRTIAFSSDRSGRRGIWVKDLANGGEVALTEGQDDDHPRFSPDGSMILFIRRSSIYRVAILGGEPRKLIDNVFGADWSPDGRQIAFVRMSVNEGKRRGTIWIASANSEGAHEIAHVDNAFLTGVRWSPNGRTLATPQLGTPDSIFSVSADGKAPHSVRVPEGFGISQLAWSGDGSHVVYLRADSVVGENTTDATMSRVILQHVKTGAAQVILSMPHNATTLDIAGPGRLVFDTGSSRQNLAEISLRGNAAAAERRWLNRGNSQDRESVYGPGGDTVIFSSNRSGNLDLWQISRKTGAVRRVTDDPADDFQPAVTPDGTKLVWSSNRSGHFEVWIADADGGGARQLTQDEVNASDPAVTSDGRWIVYASDNPAKQGVWKIRPDGSGAIRLIAGSAYLPEVSSDGQYLLCQMSDSVRVFRFADGAAIPFEISIDTRTSPTEPQFGRPHWTRDGRAIAFIGRDEKGLTGVFVQDFSPGQDTTKSRRRLAGFDPDLVTETFGLSPDGSYVTISFHEQLFSVMMAERVPGIIAPKRVSR